MSVNERKIVHDHHLTRSPRPSSRTLGNPAKKEAPETPEKSAEESIESGVQTIMVETVQQFESRCDMSNTHCENKEVTEVPSVEVCVTGEGCSLAAPIGVGMLDHAGDIRVLHSCYVGNIDSHDPKFTVMIDTASVLCDPSCVEDFMSAALPVCLGNSFESSVVAVAVKESAYNAKPSNTIRVFEGKSVAELVDDFNVSMSSTLCVNDKGPVTIGLHLRTISSLISTPDIVLDEQKVERAEMTVKTGEEATLCELETVDHSVGDPSCAIHPGLGLPGGSVQESQSKTSESVYGSAVILHDILTGHCYGFKLPADDKMSAPAPANNDVHICQHDTDTSNETGGDETVQYITVAQQEGVIAHEGELPIPKGHEVSFEGHSVSLPATPVQVTSSSNLACAGNMFDMLSFIGMANCAAKGAMTYFPIVQLCFLARVFACLQWWVGVPRPIRVGHSTIIANRPRSKERTRVCM